MMIILQCQSLFLTGLDEYLELMFYESSERVGKGSAICAASISFEVYAFLMWYTARGAREKEREKGL